MQRKQVNYRTFKTPFCREYWKLAFAEFKNTKMIVFAALILALRIAVKPLSIPVAGDLKEGIGFISFSPLAQGLLTDRYLNGIPQDSRMSKGKFLREEMLTPELLQQLRQWNDEAQQKGESLAEMALAWILKQQGVTSVLVGASSTEQLARNLRCIEAQAPDF